MGGEFRSFWIQMAAFAAVVVGTLTGQPWLIAIGLSITANQLSQLLAGGLTQRQEGMQVNTRSVESAMRVVYGRAKIGIQVADVRQDPNDEDDLSYVGVLCLGGEGGHGIEAVEEIRFNEKLAIQSPVFEGEPRNTGAQPWLVKDGTTHCFYGLHAGADAQTVDAELNSRFPTEWGTDSPGKGVAYLALFLTYHKEIFFSGVPNVTAIVKGAKVFDPRDDTWKWSDNPALCLLDYLTSERYGLGAFYPERDGGDTSLSEIEEQDWIDAANHCDEMVSVPGGGSEKRYTCNGVVDTGRSVGQSILELLSSCRGTLVYQGGKYRLHIRQAQSPTSFELDEDNIVGDWQFKVVGSRDTPNVVRGTFVDEDANWQPNTVQWPEPDATNAYLSNDNDLESAREFDLPFTHGYYRAQRIVMTHLKEGRADVLVGVTAKEEALQLQVGDVVPVTHSTPGWTDKEFWVAAAQPLANGHVRLFLQEYDADAYTTDTQSQKDSLPGSGLPDPFTVEDPTGLTLVSDATTALETQGGQRVPRIRANWTDSVHPWLDHTEIRYRVKPTSGDPPWDAVPPKPAGETQQYIGPVTDGETYQVEIRAVSTLGVTSSWVQQEVTAGTQASDDTAAPILDWDGNKLYLYPRRSTALSVRWVVDTEDKPTQGEVEAGTVSTADEILVYTANKDGQRVWVGMIAYANNDGTGDQGPLHVLPETYSAAGRRPVVTWKPFTPTDTSKEGVRFVARDDGSTVDFQWAVIDDGQADPDPLTNSTGQQSDPVEQEVEVTKPAEGGTKKVIVFNAVDADGNWAFEQNQRVYIDGDARPSGDFKGDIDERTRETFVTPQTIDTDSGSYRYRVVLDDIDPAGDPFVDPVFNDAAPDEFAGTDFGVRTKLPSDYWPTGGKALYVSGWFFRTTSTTGANQQNSGRSDIVRIVIPLAIQQEHAVLKSFELTFDESLDQLVARGVGGKSSQSARLDISDTEDFSANVTTDDLSLSDGTEATLTKAIAAADRGKPWYGRITVYDGPLTGGVVTGNAGDTARDSVDVGGGTPTVQLRYELSQDKDQADVYAVPTSPVGEPLRLFFRHGDGSTTWSLVQGNGNPAARYVTSGQEVDPTTAWFHDGGTGYATKLNDIALNRDQVTVVEIQAKAQYTALEGPWETLSLPLKAQPWLESGALQFDEVADKLKLTGTGGAHCQSAKFEISDDPTFATVEDTEKVNLADGASHTAEYAVAAGDREKMWYGRITPYNGALDAGEPTGLAGVPVEDREYVPSAEASNYVVFKAVWVPSDAVLYVPLNAHFGADTESLKVEYSWDADGVPSSDSFTKDVDPATSRSASFNLGTGGGGTRLFTRTDTNLVITITPYTGDGATGDAGTPATHAMEDPTDTGQVGIRARDGTTVTQSQELVAGTNVSFDTDAQGNTRINTTSGGVTDHGALTGLGDDDHAQYVHKDVARTITAQHAFDPTVAQAPFSLGVNAQGQLVTGLNADLLDGKHGSEYALASHTHPASDIVSGTFAVARGGTGRSTLTDAALIVGAGSAAVNFLSPGTAGQVVRSTGTAWASAQLAFSDLSGSLAFSDLSGSLADGQHGDRSAEPGTMHDLAQISGTLPGSQGGTGTTSYTKGDLLYAAATGSALSKLAIGTADQVLAVSATGIPGWVDLSDQFLPWDSGAGVWDAARSGVNKKIRNVADPTLSDEAATKNYVDDKVVGRHLGDRTSDPSSPQNGDIWTRSDLGTFRYRSGGTTYELSGFAI